MVSHLSRKMLVRRSNHRTHELNTLNKEKICVNKYISTGIFQTYLIKIRIKYNKKKKIVI